MNNTKEKVSAKMQKINAAIEKTNAEFKKATKAQKRVMIAKDVLAQLKAKRYIPESGVWVEPMYKSRKMGNEEESVQKLFAEKNITKCNVCALGAMFMSCTNMNNNTTVGDLEDECGGVLGELIEDNYKLSNGLNRIFTCQQLALIETYFENGGGYFETGGRYFQHRVVDYDHLDKFSITYNEDKRLELIMKNIIENQGTFKPKKMKI